MNMAGISSSSIVSVEEETEPLIRDAERDTAPTQSKPRALRRHSSMLLDSRRSSAAANTDSDVLRAKDSSTSSIKAFEAAEVASTISEESVLPSLHPDFDASVSHLMKLFTLLDTDGDGFLTYEQLGHAVRSMNAFEDISEDQIMKVIQAIDTDNSLSVSMDEFVTAMQEHAARCFPGDDDTYEIFVLDYAPSFARVMKVVPDSLAKPASTTSLPGSPNAQRRTSQLGGQAALGQTSHWQGVTRRGTNLSTSTLSNAPGVPLVPSFTNLDKAQKSMALSDLVRHIVPSDGTRVRWISYVGTNAPAFVRLAYALKLHPMAIQDVLEMRQRSKVEVYKQTMQILLGKVIHDPNSPSRDSRQEHMSIFMIDEKTVLTVEQTRGDYSDELMSRIKYTGSKLRLNDARYLVHSILDGTVDSLGPVVKEYQTLIAGMYRDIHEERGFQLDNVRQMQKIYRESVKISNWLRPMRLVLNQLRETLGEEDKNLQRHMADVVDNLETIIDQTVAMENQAKSLNDDFVNMQQYKMNKVMYFLTLITTIFIPAQFLTGLYGMNFEYMPELHYKWAYLVFWLVFLLLVCTMLYIFKRYHWLSDGHM